MSLLSGNYLSNYTNVTLCACPNIDVTLKTNLYILLKCQMSSGPTGPMLFCLNTDYRNNCVS